MSNKIFDLRMRLIRWLAGKSGVVLNVSINGSFDLIVESEAAVDHLMINGYALGLNEFRSDRPTKILTGTALGARIAQQEAKP